jgi:hypothetical protein
MTVEHDPSGLPGALSSFIERRPAVIRLSASRHSWSVLCGDEAGWRNTLSLLRPTRCLGYSSN